MRTTGYSGRGLAEKLGIKAGAAEALAESAKRLTALAASGGAVWISWPKKSSPLFVDLTDEALRRIMLPTGWVDVKVCAVDADWSGLKFLRRRPAP